MKPPPPNILVVAQIRNNRISPASYEALGAARILDDGAENLIGAVLGNDPEDAAREFSRCGGLPVHSLKSPLLEKYTGGPHREALEFVAKELGVTCLVFPHTLHNMDLAPGLCFAMGAEYLPSVTEIRMEEGGPLVVRSVAGDRLEVETSPGARPLVLTVRPGSFSYEPKDLLEPRVFSRTMDFPSGGCRWLEEKKPPGEAADLSGARVIVAAGRGVGSRENMEIIRETAALFPRSAVAGSRTVCDLGWLSPGLQVGVTGQVVAPELYLACGISGAFQHVAGISGSRLVVAVNKDPAAPIFQAADIGVVEDLLAFLPIFGDILNHMGEKT